MWGEDWGSMVWTAAAGAPLETVPFAPWALVVLGFALGLCAMKARSARWARVLPILLVCAVPVVSVVALTLPHTFVNGEPADATEVNQNFGAVKSAVDALEARPGLSCEQRSAGGVVSAGTAGAVTASCNAGEFVTGGGCQTVVGSSVDERQLFESYPLDADSWRCRWFNAGSGNLNVTGYAICCS